MPEGPFTNPNLPPIENDPKLMDEHFKAMQRCEPSNQSAARRDEIANMINRIAICHGIDLKMVGNDFAPHTASFIRECDNGRSPLRELMIREIFPLIDEPIEVYHFTKREGALGILSEAKLRLTSLSKRCTIWEGEIRNFVECFGFPECTQEEGNIVSMAESKFYASFADTNLSKENERVLWDNFAGVCGARLKFRIQAQPPFKFRRITYASGSAKLASFFKEINEEIRLQFDGRFLVFNGWSDFVGFYLAKPELEYETEIRLLFDTKMNGALVPVSPAGGTPYLEFAIDSNNTALRIELLEVVSDYPLPTLSGITLTRRIMV